MQILSLQAACMRVAFVDMLRFYNQIVSVLLQYRSYVIS